LACLGGNAKAQLGADEEAVTWMRRGLEANRNLAVSHFFLAAALAHLDRLDEAQAAAQSGLALDPSFTIRRFRLGAAADNPTYLAGRERIIEGMRKAGVPQG
jgi:tetratricopeptide (TPR) repeat protein